MHFLKSLAVALLALCSVSSAFAADFSGKTVTTITFKDDHGSLWPHPERLMPLIVQKPGEPFSGENIRAGLEYLYLRGLFKDVRVEGFPDDSGVRLVYTPVPITVVERVAVKGNHALSSRQIDEVLSGLEGAELHEEKFPDLKTSLLALYQAEGYYHVAVNFRVEKTAEPHRVILRVEIHESKPTRIEEIMFSGNTVFTQRDLLDAIKSEKGDRLRRDVLLDEDTEAITRKYTAAGYPAAKPGPVSMSFRDTKAYVYIPVTEGLKVTVSFTGNHEFSSNKLKKELLIWSEHDISDSVLEGSADKIKNLYKEKGYADVKVELKKTEETGRLDLKFSIQEGQRTTVKEIIIQGNTFFPAKQIKKMLLLRESGWFKSRPYREDVLDKDAEYLKDQYVDSGFLSAVVQKKASFIDEGKKAVVTIEITEGPQTRVGRISFEGNRAFTDTELLGKLSLKSGAPFSERLLDEDRYRILSAYSNKGYLYSKVEVEKKPVSPEEAASAGIPGGEAGKKNAAGAERSKQETMDILYRIAEDIQVTIGRVILRGNVSTRDGVILRELRLKTGDPYDYEAILKSQQRIYRLGYFGMARFEPVRPGEKEQVKDMLLTVEERPAGAFEFGVGYGDLDRFRAFAEVSHRNLWGTARYAGIRFEESDILQRASFNFREPWFLGQELESKFGLVWSDMKRLNPDTREIYYQTRKTSVSYGVEKPYNGLKLSLMYQFENVTNYNVKPGAELSPEDSGQVRISSLTPGLLLDLRDDYFNPRKGSLHGIAVKEAMKELGSEADFTKVTLQSSWFFPLDSKVVLALSGRSGMAWPHGETQEVPLHERFYLGGSTTVRGYVQDSIGPKGSDRTPTGGSSMVVFNAELRTNPAGGFGLVFFADAGNVWVDQAINLGDLRASYGTGLRYNTPIGPLRVDYGQKVYRRPGESPGELHFNIGHTF